MEGGRIGNDGVGGGEVFLGRGAAGFLPVLLEVLLQLVFGAEGEVRSGFGGARVAGRLIAGFRGGRAMGRGSGLVGGSPATRQA